MVIHIISHIKSGWSVVKQWNHRATRVFKYKRSAVAYAKKMEGVTRIIVHSKTGVVEGVYKWLPYVPNEAERKLIYDNSYF